MYLCILKVKRIQDRIVAHDGNDFKREIELYYETSGNNRSHQERSRSLAP